jgi:hypothetical protein
MVCWCVLIHSGQILSDPSSYLHKSLESQSSVSMHVTNLSGNSNPELYISSNQSSVSYSQSLLCLLPNLDKECLGMSITMNMLSTFVFYWDELTMNMLSTFVFYWDELDFL